MCWLPQDIPSFPWCSSACTRFCRCRIRCCSEILQVVFLEAKEPSYPPPPIDSTALGSAEFHYTATHMNLNSPGVSEIPLLIPIVDLARRRDFQAAIDLQMRSGNINDSCITPTANGGGHADLRQMDVDPHLRWCCHRVSRLEVWLRWTPARQVCVL